MSEMKPPARSRRIYGFWGVALVAGSVGTSLLALDKPIGMVWVNWLALPLCIAGFALAAVPGVKLMSRGNPLGLIGLVLGVLFLGAILLPARSTLGEKTRRHFCKEVLRQIGFACSMYAADNYGAFPPSLRDIRPSVDDRLRCPSDTGRRTLSYGYESGLRVDMPQNFILAYDESLDNHKRICWGTGRNVLFADGHVEWWPTFREIEFQERLAVQRTEVDRLNKAFAETAQTVERLLKEMSGSAVGGTIAPARLQAAIQTLGGPPKAVTGIVICLGRLRLSRAERAAAARLAAACGEPGQSVLANLINDKDVSLRCFVIQQLTGRGGLRHRHVHDLCEALKDPDAQIRGAAAMALGRAGLEASCARADLQVALKDKDPAVRKAAAEALKNIRRE